ncbi:MAG: hypothetical protein RSD07_01390 [Angelakisella sp.]
MNQPQHEMSMPMQRYFTKIARVLAENGIETASLKNRCLIILFIHESSRRASLFVV